MIIDILNKEVEERGFVTIVHTWFDSKTYHTFSTGEEALSWISRSIYGHIENDLEERVSVDGHVCGQVYFNISRTLPKAGGFTYESRKV